MSVACGNKVHDRSLAKVHHHDSVAQVKLCFTRPTGLKTHEEEDQDHADQVNSNAELEAEKRNERWFEERGVNTYAGSEEEARDRYFDGLNWDAAVATEQPGQWVETVAGPQQPKPEPFPALPDGWRDGVYTVETALGHRTFRFRTQQNDSKFKPGVQLVAYLSGTNNEFANGDYTQFGEVSAKGRTTVWKKQRDNAALEADYREFLAAPDAALAAVHCYRCKALLTVPESVRTGWGPECLKKGLR